MKGKEKMNILHLEYSGHTGGIEKLCRDIGRNAYKDKHYFIFVHEGGCFYEQMKDAGLDVKKLNFENWNILKLYMTVDKLVHEYKIDAIIIHHPAPLMWISMLLYLRHLHNAKVLVYVHNVYVEITKCSRIRKIIYNKLLKKCDGIISISEFVKKTVIENTKIPQDKVRVIYNGVECKNQSITYNGRLNTPIRIIYVGRLIEKKGVQVLLKAVASLKNEISCTVQIVGDGPYRTELEILCKELHIEDNITFYGNQSNIQDWLEKADIFVHPAIWQEGFGITIAEALSYGKICIASHRGAIPEIIEDGKNGFLVEADNPDALAKKISYVCNIMTTEQRLNIQYNSIIRAKKFSIEKLMKELHDYLLVLKGR